MLGSLDVEGESLGAALPDGCLLVTMELEGASLGIELADGARLGLLL